MRNAAKRVADTSSSNISERVLDNISHRVFACMLEAVCLRSNRPKSMLTDTRNEVRLVFPQRGWGPKYPTSRGLFLLRFAYFDQLEGMPKRLYLASCNI